ncbi:MBL fold metallo-hydrolase [Adhaeribacter pallidiroseus]|uniref:Hydroxyacylglutathione hydrolase n=1 Tax=Adhaeribacter pallidiroseus TaxID=2072847 RepID=A0A369QM71_9BACT|nr:rhodanese-like domain-containing protein [Adhaeribacter pallidiroseus]RDC64337.1 Hydroxyacylglutathione hydrolase [Adhaeribacter pallidiroseus]
MRIEQFEDKGLAHFSYVISSEGQMAVIDPARNPQPYYDYANLHDLCLIAVIETHPHADFVSSHQEIAHTKEATIYASKLTGAAYAHKTFDEGDSLQIGEITLHALNTPGHSPDSISVLVKDENNQAVALFSGDTLFIGDVGRPDLRENTGSITAKREELARQMYYSIREKIMALPDTVTVYPAHGAGSLCGKGMSEAKQSSIGAEKKSNPALQPMSETDFLKYLLADQPFVPKYFPFAVDLNKHGAPSYRQSLAQVPYLPPHSAFDKNTLLIDTRPQQLFKQGHIPGAINLQDGLKFETWLGSVVGPQEKFYVIAESEEALETIIAKTAKIGYERQIKGGLINPANQTEKSALVDVDVFKNNPDAYTIIDIRNHNEVKEGKFFPTALVIPLPELREAVNAIPTNKPILVHCAGGYRSAAGASIIARKIKDQPVYDLSEAVKDFS